MVGASTAAMTIAVSRAGGLGSVGAGAMSPADIEAEAAKIRAATDAPFAINLFVLERARPDGAMVEQALERLAPWYEARGLDVPPAPNDFAPDFEAQFAAALAAAPAAVSATFGAFRPEQVAALKARDILVVGTATSVAEAKVWADLGADAICAQGGEAGGHRGTFIDPREQSLIGTMALVPLAIQATGLPTIAAGGIMDGAGVAAALALGAVAAQMGTAFLLSDETVISQPWKRAIETAADDPTRVTRVFSGRYARGIENDFMRRMGPVEQQIPDYPVQNRLTQPLRAAAGRLDDAEVISLWAGQGVKLAGPGEAGALVERWWGEAQTAVAQTAARLRP